MIKQIRMFLAVCVISLIGVVQAESVVRIFGANIEGPLPPAGSCAVFSMTRNSAVQTTSSTNDADFDIDTTGQFAYVTRIIAPLQGASVVNNLFKVDISTNTLSLSSSGALAIVGNPGSLFCSTATNFCNDGEHIVVDKTNGFVYSGGIQSANNQYTVAAVTASTLAINAINVFAGSGPGNTALTFDSALSWFGVMSLRDTITNPNSMGLIRLNRDATATTVQGPVSNNLASNNNSFVYGGATVDKTNSYIYGQLVDNIAGKHRLLTYNFSLADQGTTDIESGGTPTPGAFQNHGILWVNIKNELVVCTSNYTLVYSGFPFTLKRSDLANGCNSPSYDSVNNKLYVVRSGQLVRLNYATLAVEQSVGFAGLYANSRTMIDAARQKLYAIESSGPLGGTALAKYTTCTGF